MSNKHNLPPLPEPDERTRRGYAFSAFAMHDYALAAIQRLEAENEARQAKIDALMFEFCPGEMTTAQIAAWASRQVIAKQNAAIDEAMTKEHP